MKKVSIVSLIAVFSLLGCGGSTSSLQRNTKTVSQKANTAGTLSVALPAGASESEAITVKPTVENTENTVIEVPRERTIEITEKMFIAQTNDVYLNPEDYTGKTIKLEGLFKAAQYAENAPPYCFVLRYGPGCCGSDGDAGFEVAWNKQGDTVPTAAKTYPNIDDWVEAVGVLKTYEENGYPYLYLALSELNVLDKRGAEYVTQ
ncbi:TIGR03943 family putative permease subunit [Breznakiellaceae bacterium SP9]